MKKLWSVVLGLSLLLCGCTPTAREPDQLDLVAVLGVDGGGPVVLYGVGRGDTQQPVRAEAQGETFLSARERLPWSGERELALTNVEHLVVGPDADLAAVLYGILEDKELGASAHVWFSAKGAQELLEGGGDPVGQLELLLRQGVSSPTVIEVLAELCDHGTAPLPRLYWTGEKLEAGEAVLWQQRVELEQGERMENWGD